MPSAIPAIAAAVVAVLCVPDARLHAQASPRDSVARDSVRRDSVARDTARRDTVVRYRNPHGMQAALYALVLAPGLLTTLPDHFGPVDTAPPPPRGPIRLGFWRDHASLSVAAGYAAGSRNPPLAGFESWTGAMSVEALVGRTFLEARLEQFRVPESMQYRTVRVGRFARPYPSVVGGVTLGYRDVRGPRPRHRGVEVGFPFVAGRPDWWVRLESDYVMSLHQSTWSYRVQYERLIAGGPFFAGAGVEFKTWEIRRQGELSHSLASIVLGTTRRGRP